MSRTKTYLFASVAAAVLATSLSACASKSSSAKAGAQPGGASDVSCTYRTGNPPARNVGKPPSAASTVAAYTATLNTSQGAVTLKLNAAKAPCTVNSFVFLAGKKYFDGTTCHRLTTAGIFVLQCGDPTATGGGGPGYQFADENLKGATYPAGTVAMANAGPGTNGSQFFLVYKDTTLGPNYTPFGTIDTGLDVITKIAAAGSDESHGPGDGKPKLPVNISHLTIATK
ncbi:MAG: peptidyl-prolyl cis-trans isomerase [Actinomycetota bacterium]|nr:peptidyl-prolyl cis-trans isomerase [Actinomycetota bacterium]